MLLNFQHLLDASSLTQSSFSIMLNVVTNLKNHSIQFSFPFISFHAIGKKSILLSENLFLFNLRDKCFWQLTEVSIANISSIKFVPTHFHKKQKKKQDDDNNNNEDFNGDWSNSSSTNLLMGNKSGFIYEIEISKYNNNSSSS